MAQLDYRANLQTALFPLLAENGGDTVIITNRDATYERFVSPDPSGGPLDRGIPQIIYGHNVMPSTYGFQSVGYKVQYPAFNAAYNFDAAYLMVSVEGIRTYIGVDYTVAGTLFALQQSGTWAALGGAPSIGPANRVSVATVNGISYLCLSGLGTYTYSVNTNSLTRVTLKGLDDGNIIALATSTGYLIALTKNSVAWSATDDPLDFVPSDITGAGGGSVQEATGNLIHAQETSYGFILYTENNVVSVTYSGNATFPFNFKAITGGGGVASSDLVCVDSVNSQYAYTTKGLQQIYHTGAKTVLSYITDFVAGQVFEDFDEETNTFSISSFTHTMRKKLSLVSDRYLVLSYGMNQGQPMTHAIVLDVPLTRMGKLKITHNQVFELRNLAPEVIETPRESIALLDKDGTVRTVDFGLRAAESKGVMLLGKYSYTRSRRTTIQQVRVSNVQPENDFEILDMITEDGTTLQPAQTLYADPPKPLATVRDFYSQICGVNHTLVVKGNFNLSTLILSFTLHGVQ